MKLVKLLILLSFVLFFVSGQTTPTLIRIARPLSGASLTVSSSPFTLTPIISGETLTWSSSDTNVLTVNSGGRVTVVGEGTATIRVQNSLATKVGTEEFIVKAATPTVSTVFGYRVRPGQRLGEVGIIGADGVTDLLENIITGIYKANGDEQAYSGAPHNNGNLATIRDFWSSDAGPVTFVVQGTSALGSNNGLVFTHHMGNGYVGQRWNGGKVELLDGSGGTISGSLSSPIADIPVSNTYKYRAHVAYDNAGKIITDTVWTRYNGSGNTRDAGVTAIIRGPSKTVIGKSGSSPIRIGNILNVRSYSATRVDSQVYTFGGSATLDVSTAGGVILGELSIRGADIYFAPAIEGVSDFSFVVNDGEDSGQATFTFRVTPPNRRPILAKQISDKVVAQNKPFSFIIPLDTFRDVDGDTLTYSVTGLPSGLTFDSSTRTISGIASQNEIITLTVEVTDPYGGQADTQFVLTVTESLIAIIDGEQVSFELNEQVISSDNIYIIFINQNFVFNSSIIGFKDVDIESSSLTSKGATNLLGTSSNDTIDLVDSTLINNQGGLIISTLRGDDVITATGSITLSGGIDGGLGNDQLNLGTNLNTVTTELNGDIINIERISIYGSVTLNGNVNPGASTPRGNTDVRVFNNSSLTVGASGSLISSFRGLLFSGVNTFNNSAGAEVDFISVIFSDTTYIVSSSTRSLRTKIVDFGNVVIRLSDNLEEGVQLVLFSGVISPPNLNDVALQSSTGTDLRNSNYVLRRRIVGNVSDIILERNAPPVSAARTFSFIVDGGTVDLLDGVNDNREDLDTINNVSYRLNGGSPESNISGVSLNGTVLTLDADTFIVGNQIKVHYSVIDKYGRSADIIATISIVETDTQLNLSSSTVTIGENNRNFIGGSVHLINGEDGTEDQLASIRYGDKFVSYRSGSMSVKGDYGTLKIVGSTNTQANYSYVLNSYIANLPAGQSVVDTFYFRTQEGVEESFTITINGENNIPRGITFSQGTIADGFLDDGDLGARVEVQENRSGVITNVASVDDDTASSSLTYRISDVEGASGANFSIDSDSGALSITGDGLDYEQITGAEVFVFVELNDTLNTYIERIHIQVTDVNEAPSAINISNLDSDNRIRIAISGTGVDQNSKSKIIANIEVIDDALGNNQLSVIGGENHFRIDTSANKNQLIFDPVGALSLGAVFENITIRSTDGTNIKNSDQFRVFFIRNPASQLLDKVSKGEVTLASDTVVLLGHLQDVIDKNLASFSKEDNEALDELRDRIADLQSLSSTVEELKPDLHGSLATAVETVISDFANKLSERTFTSVNTGLLNVRGPNSNNLIIDVIGRASFWFELNYGTGDRDNGSNSYDYTNSAIYLGYEKSYGDLFLGGSISQSNSNVENGNNQGQADISTLSLGLYGSYQRGEEFFSSSLIISLSEIDATRERKVLGNLQGESESTSIDINFDYGITRKMWSYLVGLRYSFVDLDSVDESEKKGMSMQTVANSYSSLYTSIGVVRFWNFSKNLDREKKLSLFVTYDYNVLDEDRDFSSQFMAGSSQFEVNGIDADKGTITLGMAYKYENKKFIYEFGLNHRFSSISSAINLTGKVKYSF